MKDLTFWRPHLKRILRLHTLADETAEPIPGFNTTHPTFVCGDAVVKLFGSFADGAAKSYRAERATLEFLAQETEIAAPVLLAGGSVEEVKGWHYLVTRTMRGMESWRAELDGAARTQLAKAVGEQVRRLHSLKPAAGVATDADWPTSEVVTAARRTSLPRRLADQADEFVSRLGNFDRLVVHGDLTANHVFVENESFAGLIDWGDAMVTDRHCELIQVYRDLLECDKTLFRVFLDACEWPVDRGFAHKALGHALRRQGIGLLQHPTMDVFEPVAKVFPLEEFATLDELAVAMFAV